MPPTALLGLMAVQAVTSAATPDAKAEAREQVRRAGIEYNLGRYDEAAALYEAAYRLVQDPALLYNIGQAYRLGGRLDRALAAYKGYLRTASATSPHRASVEVRVAELERALDQARRSPGAQSGTGAPPSGQPPGGAGAPPASSPMAPPPVNSAPLPAPLPPPLPPSGPRPGEPLSAPVNGPAPPPGPSGQAPAAAPATPAPAQEDARLRATLGGQLGFAARLGRGEGAGIYGGYGRVGGRSGRVLEVGYGSRPIYAMNPTYQYSAVYAAYTTSGSWTFEAGALGRESGWHLGLRRQRDPLSGGVRIERLSSDALCGQADSRIVYLVSDARLRVPVSSRFAVTGAAAYRGKLSTSRCAFRPSLLTLSLVAEVDARPDLSFHAGIGHYGLVDYGAGTPTGPWPERARTAESFTLGARYTRGRTTMLADLRNVFYAGATTALLFGLEVRSSPSAP